MTREPCCKGLLIKINSLKTVKFVKFSLLALTTSLVVTSVYKEQLIKRSFSITQRRIILTVSSALCRTTILYVLHQLAMLSPLERTRRELFIDVYYDCIVCVNVLWQSCRLLHAVMPIQPHGMMQLCLYMVL